jgi:4a-hydroxytetrahydrobiopterin dehydratase
VADVAEGEGHHPDIFTSWNKVRLTLTTHKIGGLSRNDFIVAAKIDKLLS